MTARPGRPPADVGDRRSVEIRRRIEQGIASARAHRGAGRFGLARRRLNGALIRARSGLGPYALLVAVIHNQLGLVGKYAGDFPAARRHYLRALTILKYHPDNDQLELADIYHNLGGLEHARGRYPKGEAPARRAVALRAKRHGANATVTWLDRTAHAALLDGLKRFAESEAICRKALPIIRRRLGAGHYEVAVTLNNLGCACAEQGRPGEAARYLRRALALKERLFGRQHTEVAISLNNLATVIEDLGRPAEAAPLLRRALAILTRRLGPGHASTRACRANLARYRRAAR